MNSVLPPKVRPVASLDATQVRTARLVLCDLDGCLVSEGRAFADAAEFVRQCGDRFRIVSNNSTHTADALSAALRALGLNVAPDHILLAGQQTLHHLARSCPGATLALFASAAIRAEASRLGFDLDSPRPDIVLLCRDPGFSLSRLDALTACLSQGAAFWVANTDRAHPGLDGRPFAETGALLAAVRAVLGEIPFRSIGKPDPAMALAALRAAEVDAADAVFVGDNPVTDGVCAREAGVPFVHLQRKGRS